MLKNEEFTRKYLDKIITASEQHTINEWLDAFEKLSETIHELGLDIHNIGAESLKTNLAENESQITREAQRINSCTELILDSSLKIVQISSEEGFQYGDISDLIRSAWWELISFFDYSPNLYVNIYAICLFDSSAQTLEKAIKIAAGKLST